MAVDIGPFQEIAAVGWGGKPTLAVFRMIYDTVEPPKGGAEQAWWFYPVLRPPAGTPIELSDFSSSLVWNGAEVGRHSTVYNPNLGGAWPGSQAFYLDFRAIEAGYLGLEEGTVGALETYPDYFDVDLYCYAVNFLSHLSPNWEMPVTLEVEVTSVAAASQIETFRFFRFTDFSIVGGGQTFLVETDDKFRPVLQIMRTLRFRTDRKSVIFDDDTTG